MNSFAMCFPHKLLDLISCKYKISNLTFDPSNKCPASEAISLRRQVSYCLKGGMSVKPQKRKAVKAVEI